MAAKALPVDKFAAWCAQLPAGCIVAMEVCGGAHHWARKLRGYGLDSRLIAGHFVAPYRMAGKGGKNDAEDAAAICEAAGRPHMRFVPVKTPAQQALLAIHRLREGYKEALLSGWYLGPHRTPSATRPTASSRPSTAHCETSA